MLQAKGRRRNASDLYVYQVVPSIEWYAIYKNNL